MRLQKACHGWNGSTRWIADTLFAANHPAGIFFPARLAGSTMDNRAMHGGIPARAVFRASRPVALALQTGLADWPCRRFCASPQVAHSSGSFHAISGAVRASPSGVLARRASDRRRVAPRRFEGRGIVAGHTASRRERGHLPDLRRERARPGRYREGRNHVRASRDGYDP